MVARDAHDGVWNDIRYYECEHKRGIFVPLLHVEPFNAGKRKGSAGTYVAIKYYVYNVCMLCMYVYIYIHVCVMYVHTPLCGWIEDAVPWYNLARN